VARRWWTGWGQHARRPSVGENGGTLLNKINSISAVQNPTKYEQSLVRGA